MGSPILAAVGDERQSPIMIEDFEELVPGERPFDATMVVPIRNQARFVAQAVSSILNQTDVCCEIIISDDASNDDTAEEARRAVRSIVGTRRSRHRVLLRSGHQRLGRDHVHALAALASADVVVQAHGDDVALPFRVRTLVDHFDRSDAVLIGSAVITDPSTGWIDIDELLSDPARQYEDHSALGARRVGLDEILSMPEWMVGATLAWRPRSMAPFSALSQGANPASHDRIMAFRAFLAGGLFVDERPLVVKRAHPDQWSRVIVDRSTKPTRRYGWAVARLPMLDQMDADLESALDHGLIDQTSAGVISDRLAVERHRWLVELRDSYGELADMHLVAVWMREDEVATWRSIKDG